MSDKLDELLKDALTPSEEPSVWLNQSIVRKAKGDNIMKKPFFKTMPVAAALAIGILAAGSLTTYAAWKYLSVEQVAEDVGDEKLADTFRDKNGTISVNESQISGNYKVTLKEIASGKNLSDFMVTEDDGTIRDDRTYAVVSIEKKDGSAMPDTSDDDYGKVPILVTPFIKGEAPWQMNIFYMNAGASTTVKNGVMYQIIDCDNLEAFAGRGVYLGVLDDQFVDNTSYAIDKETGEITPKKDYDGMNILFNLPLDKSKADEEAANKQLAQWRGDAEGDDAEQEDTEDQEQADEEDWTPEKVMKECSLIKESVQKVKADKDGYVSLNWKYQGGSGSTEMLVETKDGVFADVIKEGKYGTPEATTILGSTGSGEDALIETLTCEKDGTYTFALYRPGKEK